MSDLTRFWLPIVITLILSLITMVAIDWSWELKLIICLIALWLVALTSAIFYGLDLRKQEKKVQEIQEEKRSIEDENIQIKTNLELSNNAMQELRNAYNQLYKEAQDQITVLQNMVQNSEIEKNVLQTELDKTRELIAQRETPLMPINAYNLPKLATFSRNT